MVRILVLGATGYIGLATCEALRRNSHVVYGLARSPAKATELAKLEMIPVLGTAEGGEYVEAIESANIDVVIDAAGANQGSVKILEDLKKVGAQRLERRKGKGPRLGFIYVSGTWVHGSSRDDRLNDLNPVHVHEGTELGSPAQAPSLVSWRPDFETSVLAASDILQTMVVRPALVYGRGCAIWTVWFDALQRATEAKQSKVEVPCNADAVASLVHVDEVATGLVAAAEQLSKVADSSIHPIFDLTTSREALRPILEAAAKTMGYEGEVRFIKPSDDFTTALCTSARLDSTRMRDLLGWQSKRMFGMLDEIEILVAAWQACSGRIS